MGGMFSNGIGFLIWIAAGLLVVGLIIILVSKLVRKDNSLSTMEKNLKQKNYSKVLSTGQSFVDQNINDYLIKYYMAQAYEGMQDLAKAAEFYEMALIAANEQGHIEISTQLKLKAAHIYKKMHRPKEALGYYMMVLEKQPRHSKALYEAGEIFYKMQNYRKAKEHMELLVKMKPDNLRAKYLMASIYYQLGDYSKAAKLLADLREKLPKEDAMLTKTLFLLSDSYVNLRNYGNAAEVIRPLLQTKNHFDKALLKMIECYIYAEKFPQAIKLANENLNRVNKAQKTRILYSIASAYFKHGDISKALHLWKKAFKIDPNFMDLKDIMRRYKIILETPGLEKLFSNNATEFQGFVEKLIPEPMIIRVEKRDNFWAFVGKEGVYVAYKRPFAMNVHDLDEVERIFRNDVAATMNYFLYSLYGLGEGTKNHVLFRKMTVYSTDELVRMVRAKIPTSSSSAEN